MANIATELNTIATATYGSDMREAIHDGLEKTNTDPAGKAFGNPFMYVVDFIDIDTNKKTVSLLDGNYPDSDSESINIVVGNRVRATTKQTVSYDVSDGNPRFIFIDANDLTLKVDSVVPSGGNDLILVGVITTTEETILAPGFNLRVNGHISVNNPNPVGINSYKKENSLIAHPYFGHTNASLRVAFNSNKSVTFTLTGGKICTQYGNIGLSTKTVTINHDPSSSDWYYLLLDVDSDDLKATKNEFLSFKDAGCMLIGAVYFNKDLEEDGFPNINVSVCPGIHIYPHGSMWVDSPYYLYALDTAGVAGGIGIDYYKDRVIYGNSSNFNLCTDVGATPLTKNKEESFSGTRYIMMDYFKKELKTVDTGERPLNDKRYHNVGCIDMRRRNYVSTFGNITRDGNSYYIFGDSIQTNSGVKNEAGTTIYGSVGFQVASALNVFPRNFAVSGMGFVRQIDGEKFYDKLVQAGSTYSNGTTVPIAASLVGGTNDYGTSQLLGDLDTPNSFVYEVDRCFKYIHDNFYQIPFLVCTPLHRDDRETANSYGKTLSDYCDVIKERAQHYHLLFYDLYNDPNYDFRGEDNLMPDGLHPNYFGHRRLAPLFKSLLICG